MAFATALLKYFLAIIYGKSPATIQDWIKDYRVHARQRTKAPKSPQITPNNLTFYPMITLTC
jgi:hypothetical protein